LAFSAEGTEQQLAVPSSFLVGHADSLKYLLCGLWALC